MSKPVGPYAGKVIPMIKVTGQEAVCIHIPHTTPLPGGTLFRRGNCGVIWSKDSMQVQSHFTKLHSMPWLCEIERVPMYPTPSLHAPMDPSPPTPPMSPGLQGKCRKLHLEGIVWRPHQTHKQTQGTSAKDLQGTSSCDANTCAGSMLGTETVVLTTLMSRTDEGGG
jgi:hypothetical protein